MWLKLLIVLERVMSAHEYIHLLVNIHRFLLNTDELGEDFKSFYLKGDTPEEGRIYQVPKTYLEFEAMLKEQNEYIHQAPFIVPSLPGFEFYLLGLWNGKMFDEGGVGVRIHFSQVEKGNETSPHNASIEFEFVTKTLHGYYAKKATADQIVSLASTLLPFKYATFYDFEYLSSYGEDKSEIYTGGILYCTSAIVNQFEGYKRTVSSNLMELAALDEPLDHENLEHIRRTHAFEKRLLGNRDFRQLMQR